MSNTQDTTSKLFQQTMEGFISGLAGGKPKQEEKAPEELFSEEAVGPKTEGTKKKFSAVFGFVPPSGIDHLITVFDKKDWPEHVRKDIPAINKTYEFNPEVLEDIVIGIEFDAKVSVSGPTGAGKTSIVKQIAAHTNRPYMRLNGKDGVETSSFLGMPWVEKDEDGSVVTRWKDGLLPIACKQGYLLAFDEWTKVVPGINMAIQWLLEDEGKLMLDDMPAESLEEKLITPHKDFRIVLCDNVKGLGDGIDKFGATNVQDSSTLNRFGVCVTMGYMSPEKELAFLQKKYPALQNNLGHKMIQLANQIRKSYDSNRVSLTVSPRNLLNWTRFVLYFRNPAKTFRMSYFESLASDAERGHVAQLYKTVFGNDL